MSLSRSKALLYQILYLIHINDLDALEAIYGAPGYEFLYDSDLLFRFDAAIFQGHVLQL